MRVDLQTSKYRAVINVAINKNELNPRRIIKKEERVGPKIDPWSILQRSGPDYDTHLDREDS